MTTDRRDTVGKALLAVGGGLTIVAVPLIAGAVVLFGIVLAIGFGGNPDSGEINGLILGAILVVGTIVVVATAVLILALTGQAWAQVLLLIAGAALAWMACPFPERLGADYQRPEDIEFTLVQLGVMLLPAMMAVGALLRLTAGPRRISPGGAPGQSGRRAAAGR